jgi:V/A-type H+/Na+-transporting ATPase subunit E
MAELATLLESEAQAEVESILATARSTADSIVQTATEQAKSLLEGRKRVLENELLVAQVRAKSAADLESAALRLSGNHEATSSAFSQAESELKNFATSSEYKNVLEKLIKEVQGAMGEISKLEVHPNDLATASEVAKNLGLNVPVSANPDIQTGVRAFATTGSTSVTNTLLGRLARAKESLLGDVARVLGS